MNEKPLICEQKNTTRYCNKMRVINIFSIRFETSNFLKDFELCMF